LEPIKIVVRHAMTVELRRRAESIVPVRDQVETAGNVQTVGRFRVVRIPLRPGTDQTAAADPRTSPNDDEDLIQF
jgi:hypothetical protein